MMTEDESYLIEGGEYPRIRQGDDGRPRGKEPCYDCGCDPGDYHIPGCDMERCPKCGQQCMYCDCLIGSRCKTSTTH